LTPPRRAKTEANAEVVLLLGIFRDSGSFFA
jgi:hypothetical protein